MNLKVGILGAARVATYAMIDAAKDVDGVEVVAVASRDLQKAKAYAQQYGIGRWHEGYAAMIDDPELDIIYNALPPNLHAQWSIAALAAGKDVLCEKPFALSVADVEAMLAAEEQSGRLLMEAQHNHYHPLHDDIRELTQSGALGTIRHIEGTFNVPIERTADELRWIGDVGGGALWDLGVYPVYWLREAMAAEPSIISATHRQADTGADIETHASFSFPCGATGAIHCSMEGPLICWLRIKGDKGELYVENPISPQKGHKLILTIDGKNEERDYGLRPSYNYQLEALRDAVVKNAPVPTRGEDSLATIRLLEGIRTKAMENDHAG
jgi:predicted dehydrogenase